MITEQDNGYAVEERTTLQQRIMRRLFPIKHCFAPDAPSHYKDCINQTTVSKLSFIERLRVLVTGIIVVHSRIVTENEVGNTVAQAECYVGTSKDLWS